MSPRTPGDYCSSYRPAWCKGCSYYGILTALCEVFAAKQIDPNLLCVVSGIGCSSRIPFHLKTFGIHTLHGRAIPVAAGLRMANPKIRVVVAAGDGDLFSIGIGHFVHAARRNFDITVICMDNCMYAMTKNQSSPTSAAGHEGSLTPYGNIDAPLNVIEFAISCGATFVCRTFAFTHEHMRQMLNRAMGHRGFSFVEIMAPCRTFGAEISSASIISRIVDINCTSNHDTSDRNTALAAAAETLQYDISEDADIPVGVFWESLSPTFEERMAHLERSHGEKESFSSLLKKYLV